ncbi:MAG: hypothetical protein IPG82_10260 [Saprospiraceae bacterium]|nr:hypothetical protein [Saprospiraceae bacterium]
MWLPLIQIGNYVWEDTDQDGIQDPGEDSIPGVMVSLYSAQGLSSSLRRPI